MNYYNNRLFAFTRKLIERTLALNVYMYICICIYIIFTHMTPSLRWLALRNTQKQKRGMCINYLKNRRVYVCFGRATIIYNV